jgi:hypothetical protein
MSFSPPDAPDPLCAIGVCQITGMPNDWSGSLGACLDNECRKRLRTSSQNWGELALIRLRNEFVHQPLFG